MSTLAAVLLCLVCTGLGRRVHILRERLQAASYDERQDSRLIHFADCASPVAAWQISGPRCSLDAKLKSSPKHTCRGEACMDLNQVTRRSALALLTTAGALLGSVRSALASPVRKTSLGIVKSAPVSTGSADGGEIMEKMIDLDGTPRMLYRLPEDYENGYTLPIQDITQAVFGTIKRFPDNYPFSEKDMAVMNDEDDRTYYSDPQFQYSVDEGGIAALTHYYNATITKSNLNILDLGTGWVSNYPKDFTKRMRNIVGLGINRLELQVNPQLSEFDVRDLNKEPKLPLRNSTFDVVTCAMSIPYFTSPLQIFREVHRVLKPGGRFIISSTRNCDMRKAVNVWLRFPCLDRQRLIGAYFHYAGGYSKPKAFDITAQGTSARRVQAKDMVWIVEATKL